MIVEGHMNVKSQWIASFTRSLSHSFTWDIIFYSNETSPTSYASRVCIQVYQNQNHLTCWWWMEAKKKKKISHSPVSCINSSLLVVCTGLLLSSCGCDHLSRWSASSLSLCLWSWVNCLIIQSSRRHTIWRMRRVMQLQKKCTQLPGGLFFFTSSLRDSFAA